MKALKVAVVALVLLYLGDYVSLRLRIPKREPLTTVQIQVYYAIRLKGQKTEFTPADPETATCANSLFPQEGYKPCWYVMRHNPKWVEVGYLPFGMPRALQATCQSASRTPVKSTQLVNGCPSAIGG